MVSEYEKLEKERDDFKAEVNKRITEMGDMGSRITSLESEIDEWNSGTRARNEEIKRLQDDLKLAHEQIDIMHKGGMTACGKCKTLVKLDEKHLCYQAEEKGRWLHSNLHIELEVCECGCEKPEPGENGKCKNCQHDVIFMGD